MRVVVFLYFDKEIIRHLGVRIEIEMGVTCDQIAFLMHACILLTVSLNSLPRITTIITVPVMEFVTFYRTVFEYGIRVL